ncbi:MAG: neutral zinc metallopeptidase [Betaproteobacteria bacterium]|nr:neutral zinc metallopeptidase [Betaproteobacteria bacterium]
MRWEGGRRSDNVEDRRGLPLGRGAIGGGIGVVVVAVIAMFLGIDPRIVLEGASRMAPPPSETARGPVRTDPAEERLKDFVSVVLADTEDTWTGIFARGNARYEAPRLVLFTDAVQSACGSAKAAMGPFYCPGDRRVYIDLSFYRDMSQKLGAPGDFAQAYVIAHEVGHHVQNLLGIAEKVQAARARADETRANQLSVRMELQADCFAGIWAHHADRSRQILESGDIEEGLNAAAAIGDDRLQRRSQGYVVPESFTHGSSEQRVRWFRKGLEDGTLKACDTFSRSAQ